MIRYIISCKLHTYTVNKKCKESEKKGEKIRKNQFILQVEREFKQKNKQTEYSLRTNSLREKETKILKID